MSSFSPLPRRILIRKLRKLGFSGPYSATRHEYMKRGSEKIFAPNPHGKDIGLPIVKKIIRQLKISNQEFLDL
ncbi:MAG: type II toxin-antitoxin system HicA family toxin [Candidatus Nealsonbacteria bacterium]|nr:type II toxin-antitoxin system HicA family toxin [Candidatus Nealsonbacteria bacterium]